MVAVRHKLDQYFSSAEYVRPMIPYLGLKAGDSVLEPSSGQHDIVRPLQDAGLVVHTNDIDAAMMADTHKNFVSPAVSFTHLGVKAVVGNPPFNKSSRFVKKALRTAPKVALLLRLTWLEPCGDRAFILQKLPPRLIMPINPRPRFRGEDEGTDNVTVAWFIWGCKARGIVPIVNWRPPKGKFVKRF